MGDKSDIATISRGYYPVVVQACCIIEIAPGVEINRLTYIALKAITEETSA